MCVAPFALLFRFHFNLGDKHWKLIQPKATTMFEMVSCRVKWVQMVLYIFVSICTTASGTSKKLPKKDNIYVRYVHSKWEWESFFWWNTHFVVIVVVVICSELLFRIWIGSNFMLFMFMHGVKFYSVLVLFSHHHLNISS